MKKSFRALFLWLLVAIIGIVLIILTLMYDILKDAISNYAQPYITQVSQSIQGIPVWLSLIIVLVLLFVLIGSITWAQGRLRETARDKQDAYRLNYPVEHRYLSWIINNIGPELSTFVKPKIGILAADKPVGQKSTIKLAFQNIFRLAVDFERLVQTEIKNDAYGAIIEGEPGSGKTTCLYRQVWLHAKEIIVGKDDLPRIPVYLVVSDYSGETSFHEFFIRKFDRFFRYSSFLSPDIEKYLSEGRLLIFLDDDTVEGDDAQKRLEGIVTFTKKYKDNFFVIASRPNTSLGKFEFAHYRLRPFSRSNARQLLNKLLNNSQQRQAENIIRGMPNAYFWLTTNPGMLQLLAKTVQHSEKFPKSKTELVSAFIDSSLDREIHKKGKEIDKNHLQVFLEIVAFESLNKNEFEIIPEQLNLKPYGEIINLNAKEDIILPVIEICIGAGILGQSENEQAMFFTHSIIRDYFAGCYISRAWKIQKKLAIKAPGDKWINTISFASGILDHDEAKKLIQRIRGMKKYSDNPIVIGELLATSNIDREDPLVLEVVEQLGVGLQNLHRSRLQILRILIRLYNQKTRSLFDHLFFESHHNLSWTSWLSQADDTLILREQIIDAMRSADAKISLSYWVVFILTWIGVKVWKIVSIPIKINFFLFPLFIVLVEFLLNHIWIPLSIFVIYWLVSRVFVTQTASASIRSMVDLASRNPAITVAGSLFACLIVGELIYIKISFRLVQRKSQDQLRTYLDKLRSSRKLNPWNVLVAQFALQRYSNLVQQDNPDEAIEYLSSIALDDGFPYKFICQAIKELALTRDPRAAEVIDKILSLIDINQSQASFYVAWTCTVALGFINTKRSIASLLRISEEPIRKIRRIAIDSLALIGTEETTNEILKMIDFETGSGNQAMNSYLIAEAHLMDCVPVTDALLKFERPDKFFYHWKDWIEDIERGMHVQYYKVIGECVNSGKMKERLTQRINDADNAELKDKLRRFVEYVEYVE